MTSTTLPLPDLRATFDGALITPDDDAYDPARAVVLGGFDRRPAAIVRPRTAAEVARAVDLARDHGLELAVKGGGHSMAGHSTSDGGLLIDLSALRDLTIDPTTRTAWAQTGLTAGDLTTAAATHGLAIGFGDMGSVGIGGITLAGGIGYLSRLHGLTIDNLLAAEVVTADGQVLQVDDTSHPDLFWALRGGGGNFGIATRLRYRLHEVDQILGGPLVLPATPEALAGVVAAAEAAPDELSAIVMAMTAPPLPFLPSELHGQLVVMAFVAWAGPLEEGQRALAPFREVATPLADLVHPMPYADLFPPEPEAEETPIVVGHSFFTDALDEARAAVVLERLRSFPAPMRAAQFRVLGGAIARVPADATAFAHRDRRILGQTAAAVAGPGQRDEGRRWATALAEEIRVGAPGAYSGFLGDDPDRVREVYPGATWDRLVAVKRRYDPDNLFRRNHNIAPTEG